MQLIKALLTIVALFVSTHCLAEQFDLPVSKKFIGLCREHALQQHPGVITKMGLLQFGANQFRMRFEIQTEQKTNWFALCDLTTGTLLGEQKWLAHADSTFLPEN